MKNCVVCNISFDGRKIAKYCGKTCSSKAEKKRKQIRTKLFVYAYMMESGCVDCGEKDLVVLDFDHVRGEKKHSLSYLIHKARSLDTIKSEIAKCDVRCANCHRRKTARDFGWHVSIADELKYSPPKQKKKHTNKK